MNSHQRYQLAALVLIAMVTLICLRMVAVIHDQSSKSAEVASLRVGFAIEKPYAYLTPDGQVTGEAPEIFRAVMKRLGTRDIDWVQMDFAHLLTELQRGRIDAIASGMFFTPERAQVANFSRPTATVKTAIVFRRNHPHAADIHRLADLASAKHLRWTALHGSVEFDLLKSMGIPASEIRTTADTERAMQAVTDGTADTLLISAVSARFALEEGSVRWQSTLAVQTLEDGPSGLPSMVFRKEDEVLRAKFDAELAKFLRSPEHLNLVSRFGFTTEEAASSSANGQP